MACVALVLLGVSLPSSSLAALQETARASVVPVQAIGQPAIRVHRKGIVAVSVKLMYGGDLSVSSSYRSSDGRARAYAPSLKMWIVGPSDQIPTYEKTVRVLFRPQRETMAVLRHRRRLAVRIRLSLVRGNGVTTGVDFNEPVDWRP